MNDAVSHRRELAEQAARAYATNESVRVVLLTGSLARGLADTYSDVELHVFWARSPGDLERSQTMQAIDARLVKLWPWEDEEWSDRYEFGGVECCVYFAD